jgi:hypothetical protein
MTKDSSLNHTRLDTQVHRKYRSLGLGALRRVSAIKNPFAPSFSFSLERISALSILWGSVFRKVWRSCTVVRSILSMMSE